MKKILVYSILCLGILSCKAQKKAVEFTYTEYPNLSYLAPEKVKVDSLQRLNLVIPEGVENPPLLLWIGGGA